MVDVRESALGEHRVHQCGVDDAALNEIRGGWEVLAKTAAQIVENSNVVGALNEGVRDVRAEKPRAAGDKYPPHEGGQLIRLRGSFLAWTSVSRNELELLDTAPAALADVDV